jgi:Spy/CpxP family protein refolding chaperone
MKTLKTVVIITMVVLGITSIQRLYAQDMQGNTGAAVTTDTKVAPGDMKQDKKDQWEQKKKGNRIDKMAEELNLTPEQKDKISAIMKDSDEQIKAQMQKARDNVKAIWDDSNQKIKGTLTPEQVQKFDKMEKERQEKMPKKEMKERMHHDKDAK